MGWLLFSFIALRLGVVFERMLGIYEQADADSDTHDAQLVSNHSNLPASDSVWMQPPHVSKYLQYPSPLTRQMTYQPKSCGRVLTSTENLAIIADKEKVKNDKERMKAERKKRREEKKLHLGSKGIVCCCITKIYRNWHSILAI